MDPITTAGGQSPTSTVMLKKTLDFQQENVAKLLSGSAQGGGLESPQRSEALQAQGRGQKLDITV